jgi:hypothetical protein
MMKSAVAGILAAYIIWGTEPDTATKRWWSYTVALANDGMQGRDTGSAGYRKAEEYVIEQFRKAGLQGAGVQGFRQPVELRSFKVETEQSPLELTRAGRVTKLAWLTQVTIAARADLPKHVEGPLYFVGDTGTIKRGALSGAVAVMLGTPRIRKAGAPLPAGLPQAATAVLTIDNMAGPEPPRWPAAYSVAVSLRSAVPSGAAPHGPLGMRVNPESADELLAGSGHSYAELKKLFEEEKPLPNFTIPAHLRADIQVSEHDFVSDNILAVLPGSDPVLSKEYVVLSAHLDGYGIGEAWKGDSIYNGAFDDAAYVATLIDLAEQLHESHSRLKRSLLFCVLTGEEKGLLGSKYFAAHPTIPKEQLVADLNLDQVRPIFPLKILTTLALKESTLGETVQRVAGPLGIRIQADPEPERNLLRRSDHYSFLQIGVPAVNFVFGYEKGSEDEAVYRSWYAQRYHSPADDLSQPWIPQAAAKFNRFYAGVVDAVANAPERPQWSAGSEFRK